MIDTCIIPAAGRGSRWAPISGYLPKEMLPLVDKPVIDWVIKEVVESGCKRVVVVINSQKKVIRDYLSKDKSINKKAEIVYVNQEQPLGISHAMLLCKEYLKDKPFAMALPDLPTISNKPVLRQLIGAFEDSGRNAHIISFGQFPTETLHHYTECLLEQRRDKLLEIVHICPRSADNSPHHPGSKIRMSGRYIFLPVILDVIEDMMRGFKGDELKEFDALKQAMEKGQQVLGYNIVGHTYDTGNPVSYIRANTAFFKKKISK